MLVATGFVKTNIYGMKFPDVLNFLSLIVLPHPILEREFS